MIPYERTRQQTIPHSAVKIIGVGGAGANMLDRIALDGMEGAEILACNTDVRTLLSSVAPEKIQLGRNLTKGLGTGGDPALGKQAAHEAELEIRDAMRDRKIIFICVGLGGGTGSGAAPLVARLAREGGAFTVVFATTPFTFEGKRRREQAETSLNELSVLANALITFDNTRMGELVLAKQGVHEAFSAADRMISESIRAVTRIVMRPGLVNIGLDDLMAALSTPKSRCLFGSGLAHGENRAQKALKNALVSPLLDRGSLLHDTQTVLVHVCGGEDLTLYELELLMRGLSKHVPDTAQILFGASVDSAMGDALSVTLVSSLPEERLHAGLSPEMARKPPKREEIEETATPLLEDLEDDLEEAEPESAGVEAAAMEEAEMEMEMEMEEAEMEMELAEPGPEPEPELESESIEEEPEDEPEASQNVEPPRIKVRKMTPPTKDDEEAIPPLTDEVPVKLPTIAENPIPNVTTRVRLPSKRSDPRAIEDVFEVARGTDLEEDNKPAPPAAEPSGPRHDGLVPTLTSVADHGGDEGESEGVAYETIEPSSGTVPGGFESLEEIQAAAKARRPQGELLLDGGPKGKFEGQDPNLLGGEDLDIPPFLRNRK